MSTVCLVMIVKNEALVMERLINSVKSQIDHWVICDTGSTDNTIEVIKEALKDVPGELYEVPWVNFGVNRSESLKLARGKGDYLLIMDADSTLEVMDPKWKESLTADAYNLRYCRGDHSFPTTRLVKNVHNWRYEGVIHEYIVCDTLHENSKPVAFDGIRIWDMADGGCHGNHGAIAMLIRELTEKPKSKLVPRYTFYLAQSYYGLGEKETALYWYFQRSQMDKGFGEEQWFSFVMCAEILKELNKDMDEEVIPAYEAAIENRPHRLEPYYELIKYYRSIERYDLGYEWGMKVNASSPCGDQLFITKDVYDWGFDFEFGICAAMMGNAGAALMSFDKIILGKVAPDDILKQSQFLAGEIRANLGGVEPVEAPVMYGGS